MIPLLRWLAEAINPLRMLSHWRTRRFEYQEDYVEKLEEAAQRFPGIYDAQLERERARLKRMRSRSASSHTKKKEKHAETD